MNHNTASAEETSPLLVPTANEDLPPTATQLSPVRQALLIATMSNAILLNIFTVQAAVIMLPAISKAFSISTSRQQMVISTYSIASGSSMLLCGRIADFHGRWSVFLSGAAFFALSTVLVPLSSSEWALYIFRVLQGLSSAATVPSGIGIIALTFPAGRERNRAFVALTASGAIGSVLGNVAGGAIGGLLSWIWGFWIPATLSTCVVSLGFALLPPRPMLLHRQGSCNNNHHTAPSGSVDHIGGLLVATSLALLQIGLLRGTVGGWASLSVLSLVSASVAAGCVFVTTQIRLERDPEKFPLVRLSMFKNMSFTAAFLVVALFYGSFNSYLVTTSMFFQDLLKLSMIETTLRFLPGGVIGGLIGFIVAPALSIFRGVHLLVFGISCGITSSLLFALPMRSVAADTGSFSYWAPGFPAMCLCLSADIVWPVISLRIAQSISENDQSLAGALLHSANQIGRGLGVAVAAAVQAAVTASATSGSRAESLLHGIQAAQWSNVAMAVLSLVLTCIFFRGPDRF